MTDPDRVGDVSGALLDPAVWEFHDLLFHARSQAGRHTDPSGGTCRFTGRIEDARTIGEFLYRVAGVDDLWSAPGLDPAHPPTFIARPYPSAGALYELECYLVVQRCDGVDPGLYHYAQASTPWSWSPRGHRRLLRSPPARPWGPQSGPTRFSSCC